MVQIKKCRSRKHKIGGCGDPRCPEGLSIQRAMDIAVKSGKVDDFLKARALKNVKPTMLNISEGFAKLWIEDKKTKEVAYARLVPERPEIKKAISEMDRENIRSFDSLKELTTYLNDEYKPYARYGVRENIDTETGVTQLSVSSMYVDADLRGQGIGKYFRQTLTKYADEHNCIITGTPTNSGDGSVEELRINEEAYKANAIAHRERLVRFYIRHGYEYNYAYIPMDKVDYWTKEPYPKNEKWVNQLNEKGRRFLQDSGFYIRWPNGEIPEPFRANTKV